MKKIIIIGMFASVLFANVAKKETYKTNFYKTVNKQWLSNHTIPDNKMGVSNFILIDDKIQDELKEIIIGLQKSKSLTKDEKKVLDIYSSYHNVKTRTDTTFKLLKDDIQEINNAKTYQDISKLFAKFNKIGVSNPIIFEIEPDLENSTKYIVYGQQDGVLLKKEYYELKDKDAKKEIKLLGEYYKNLFKLIKLENIDENIKILLNLESKLAKIQWNNIENRDLSKMHNKMNFEKMDKTFKNLYLKDYMKELGISQKATFNIVQLSYFEKFNKLFKTVDLKVWKLYLTNRLFITYGRFIDNRFEDIYYDYQKAKGMFKDIKPIDIRALEFTNHYIGLLFGKLYIDKYFKKSIKHNMEDLIKNILNEYKIAITNSKRLSKSTRDKALNKLAMMRFNIGYPDKWRDYSALKTKKDNLLYNVQQIKIFNYNRNISKLFKPVDKNEWDGVPQDTNAYYTPTENKFVLLAGILNKPFFDLKGGYEVSYGGIGFIISHEIGHAFDDAGSLFDGNGNMKNWWSKSDHKKFDILKKKLIAQANNYEIMPGKYENGNLEVGEIIADLSGIEIVKRAYLKVALKNNIPRKEALQRFFLQIAKTWRENYRENVMKLIIDTDPHPLGEYRVNGILQNIDEFYEVFDIKKGDKMYLEPSKRVIIW